jgi:TolB protein
MFQWMLRNGLLACLLLWSGIGRAELTIEITQGSDSAVPIAVVPFANKSNGVLPQDVSRIVANNLQRSGDFDTLPTNRMLSLPESLSQVHFRDWRLLGQNYVLVGWVNYLPPTQRYEISYELIDVVSQARLTGETISTVEAGLRRVAHHISDVVYETVTGVKGAFQTRIAYVTVQQLTDSRREYRLQVADADGARAQTLFKSYDPLLSIAWSNDAQHIAYVSYHAGTPAIYLQHVASGQQRKLTSFQGINGAPAWSPDDSKMLMTLSKDGNPEIYLHDLTSGAYERLTNHYDIDTEPSWSPDGKEIVFTSGRSGKPQVYRMALADREPRRITFEGRYNARPRFSLDGKRLFFVHQDEGDFHIAALDVETGRIRVLTSTSLDESPSVSPNGRMIIYSTLRNNKSQLAVVSIDGGAKYFLPSAHGDVKEPAWSPFLN